MLSVMFHQAMNATCEGQILDQISDSPCQASSEDADLWILLPLI